MIIRNMYLLKMKSIKLVPIIYIDLIWKILTEHKSIPKLILTLGGWTIIIYGFSTAYWFVQETSIFKEYIITLEVQTNKTHKFDISAIFQIMSLQEIV